MSISALSSATAGMQSSMDLATRSAGTIASQSMAAPANQAASSTTAPQTGVSRLISPTGDVTKALIEQRQALTMFNANAKVVQADGNMVGSMLDAKA